MKVLMISEKDAANFSLAAIERAFKEKYHKVDIYAPFVSLNVLRMFDKEILVKSINDLTEEAIKDYDIVFTSVLAMVELRRKNLLHEKKFIFTYDFLIHGEIVIGGDFNFAPSLYNTTGPYYSEFEFAKMGIGEPRFDSLVYSESSSSNIILFIDSGHYPFGLKAKNILAKLLLSICEKFPDYELRIAPRYLPTDEVVTHLNKLHIFKIIEEKTSGKLPSNLKMLNEHTDIMESINQCKTVICMYTTSYISALVAKKGLIIIEGLPNEDVYDIREKRFMQTREGMKGSRALVHYSEVLEYLPNGIHAPHNHVSKELTNTRHVAEKIVSVTEYIFGEYLKKGVFPDKRFYEYENYKDNMVARENADWEMIISERLENTLKQRLLGKFQSRINAQLNLDKLIYYVESIKINNRLSKDIFDTAFNDMRYISAEILIDNHKVLEQDDIDFGILLEAYIITQRYDCIKQLRARNLGAYYFFRGKVAADEGDKMFAQQLYTKYISISHGRAFTKEISDLSQYRAEASIYLVELYLDQNDYATAKYYLNLYEIYSRKKNARFSRLIARGEAYRLLHEKWENIKGSGSSDLIVDRVRDGSIMIYGAGTITEHLVLTTAGLKQKIKVLIDQNSADGERFGFPLISPEQIVNYPDIKTILVTVPHAFEQIRSILMSIRNDLEIISISDLVDLEKDEL